MSQSEFCVEYPNGKKVYIDEEGRPSHHVTPYAVTPFAEALEVLPDPFPTNYIVGIDPASGPSETGWYAFDAAIEAAESAVATVLQGTVIAEKFDATPSDNARETHAASDALLAIIALQKACMRMIETDTPINQAECSTFVEFARQRVQVVALAVPMLKVGP